MRRIVACLGAGIVLGAIAVPAASGTQAVARPITSRAFTIAAEAFPIEPAPGNNASSLGVRPAATRLSISNAPPAAYARAAMIDLGFIEQYQPPPEDTVAECDTESSNIDRDASASPNGVQLESHCTERPSGIAEATARALTPGGARIALATSRVTGDGGGGAAVATAETVLHDISVGPFAAKLARFIATVRADGRPGGASGRGTVEIVGATIGGIAVSVTSDGVAVDQTAVPVDQLRGATAAVRAQLAKGGYVDLRLLQPSESAARDGSRASVAGGGLFFYASNNDPAALYYAEVTLLGAKAEVAVGAALDDLDLGPGPVELPPGVFPPSLTPPIAPPALPPTVGGAKETARISAANARVALPVPWPYRGLATAAAAVLLFAAFLLRKRLAQSWFHAVADRYLKG